MNKQYAYLVMVTPDNHNKYYRMTANGSTFLAEYGRVGANPQKKTYPMSRWDDLYWQKIRKGYSDQTDLHTTATVSASSGYKEIEDKTVRQLVENLLSAARLTVKKYYKVSHDEVTPAMIQEARRIMSRLDPDMGKLRFNETLLDLFTVIPRRMPDVGVNLAKEGTDEEYAKIMQREQEILDAMSGQVFTNVKAAKAEPGSDKTILDSVGLSIRPCTDKENREIISHLTPESAMHFSKAFRVYNKEVSDKLDAYMQENGIRHGQYLYHGSATCNYWNILAMGLDINPNARTAGKMFGNGTYFANRAKKSMRYTDLAGQNNVHMPTGDRAYLSVFRVGYKKAYEIYKWEQAHTRLNYAQVHAKGCDAVFAHKGVDLVNDEIIVYQNCQSAPHYIIELK